MAVLAECPMCHKRQKLKSKLCQCGADLVKLKRSKKVKYWITYRLPGGKQHFEKMKGEEATSIEYAKDAEGKRRGQKRENRILEILPQATMTFKELSDWYLNLESVKWKRYFWNLELCLTKFNRTFGGQIVADIKTSDLENYQIRRRNDGKAASTIDQEVGAAKAVINKAFQDEMVAGHILKRFRAVKKLLKRNLNQRDRVLTPAEFDRLEASASSYLKPVLRMGYNTGMRKGEVLSLMWDRVSLKDRLIRLQPEDTKDKEKRVIPICDELHEILTKLPRGIQGDFPVFTYRGKGLKTVRAGVKNACRRAGIPYGRNDGGFIYHDLRRTFVTHMRRAGVQESVIMEITGHSRGEVFDRYNQVSIEDMRQGIEKLIRYRECQSASVDQTVDQRQFFS